MRCGQVLPKLPDEEGGDRHRATAGPRLRDVDPLADSAHAEAVGRAHLAAFAANPPAVTMIVVGLLDPRWKLKMEAEAVV